jgi:hypothetical protein
MIAAEAWRNRRRRIHADDGQQTTLAVAPALYRKFRSTPEGISSGGDGGRLAARAGRSPLGAGAIGQRPDRAGQGQAGHDQFRLGGLGTTPHMAASCFRSQAGVKMVHVAYRGEAPAINDLLGGHCISIFANLSAVIGNVKAGRCARSPSPARSAPPRARIPPSRRRPPGFDAATWFGMVAPAGTPGRSCCG